MLPFGFPTLGSRESERLKRENLWRPQNLKDLSLADQYAFSKGRYPYQIFRFACFASDLHVNAEDSS